MKKLLLKLIGFYRKSISPYTPPSCRFCPTCSAYAQEAISRYGARKGSALAFKRLLRCNPFYQGDPYDPVPTLDVKAKTPSKEENHDSRI